MAGKSVKSVAERFWPKVKVAANSECWEWSAAFDGHGYGQLRCEGKNRLATHVSLELAGHARPSTAYVAMHSCDNPPCVNPAHLRWGTRKENHQDALAKGRLNLSGFEIGYERVRQLKQLAMTNCHKCGAEFQTTPLRLRTNHRNFCSAECSRDWQSRHFTGARRHEFAL